MGQAARARGHPRRQRPLRRGRPHRAHPARRGRAEQLACAGRSTSCGEDVQRLAWAVGTLAHEAFHLRGIVDEALTECYAMQSLARTAEALGATPGQARGMAVLHWETSPGQKGDRYQVPPGCADGGEHDIRKADPVWP